MQELKMNMYVLQIVGVPLRDNRASEKMQNFTGLEIRVCNQKLIFYILNQNICCGYSKEPSYWDSSFEHLKTIGKTTGLENIYNFTLKIFAYLDLWLCKFTVNFEISAQRYIWHEGA